MSLIKSYSTGFSFSGADAAVDGGWSPNDGQHFSASFRGRPLNGTQLDLRPNYAGIMLILCKHYGIAIKEEKAFAIIMPI